MAAWFEWLGDYFEHILFWLLLITFVMWLADKFYFSKHRRTATLAALAEFDRGAPAMVNVLGQEGTAHEREKLKQHHLQLPLWLEYTASFFPVILVVFVLRSFVAEPFKIPSGSMIPTLEVGDLILVNKYTYGVRLPILNTKVLDLNVPKRGDVMVFRYPKDPAKKYIKRVVGLPGDVVSYQNKRLTVNGKTMPVHGAGEYLDSDRVTFAEQFTEVLDGVEHNILNDPRNPPYNQPQSFPFRDACVYGTQGVTCKVPAGHYFMMGDNRDNSADSRFWGFVPEANIVGKAFFIWMNFSNPKRIGGFK
ncbi:MAG: signal peptidase I [Burkholderiaceae bacterium]|nr:MAG: signal peptidase I [Burkholderiaceae bacterium]